jgi:cytochrome c peroxidase
MKFSLRIFLFCSVLIVYYSCKKDQALPHDKKPVNKTEQQVLDEFLNLPVNPFNYASPALPAFFNNQFIRIQDNTPATNPVTDWGATLGRILFYDKQVSMNRTTACASCHKQEFGFTDTAQFSPGFNGGHTRRHSMSLVNARYYINGRFFWDERASTLEEQVLMPMQDVVEMGMQLDTLVKRIQTTSYYPILFNRAFGTGTVTTENIAKALAQFIRSMVSFQSKYDEGLVLTNNRNANFPNFTAMENQGKTIFMSHPTFACFSCHNTDVFIADNPRNNGTTIDNNDSGIYKHTLDPNDIGKFKTPSLKNVLLRGRYMHDGSISGIDAVLAHYNFNVKPNPALDFHLKDNSGVPLSLNLMPVEMDALKAFLETLTDHKIITDEKFSNPFK